VSPVSAVSGDEEVVGCTVAAGIASGTDAAPEAVAVLSDPVITGSPAIATLPGFADAETANAAERHNSGITNFDSMDTTPVYVLMALNGFSGSKPFDC
jgi:hypothetical protein